MATPQTPAKPEQKQQNGQTTAMTVQQQTVQQQTSLVITEMAAIYKMTPASFINTVKETLMPNGNASSSQILAFLTVAQQYRLNPFTRQIFAFPSKGGGIVPMVPIDGWIQLIQSHEQFGGMEFEYHWQDGTTSMVPKPGVAIAAVTCKLHRKDMALPIVVTEFLAECMRGTEPWQKWPIRMNRHKALIQCARYAFGFSGIYDEDEAERIVESGGTGFGPVIEAGKTESDRAQVAYANKTEEMKAKLEAAKSKTVDAKPAEQKPAETKQEPPKQTQAAKTEPPKQETQPAQQAPDPDFDDDKVEISEGDVEGQLIIIGKVKQVFEPKSVGAKGGKKQDILFMDNKTRVGNFDCAAEKVKIVASMKGKWVKLPITKSSGKQGGEFLNLASGNFLVEKQEYENWAPVVQLRGDVEDEPEPQPDYPEGLPTSGEMFGDEQ